MCLLQTPCLCSVNQCRYYHCSVHLPLDLHDHFPVASTTLQTLFSSSSIRSALCHSVGDFRIIHTFIHYKPRGFYGTTCKTSIKVPVTGNASVKIATPLWRATLHDLTPLLQVAAVIRLRSRRTGCPLDIVYIPSHVSRVLVAPFCRRVGAAHGQGSVGGVFAQPTPGHMPALLPSLGSHRPL